MKDKKEQSDLAHKLSEVCVKIILAQLAFSAAGMALGERMLEAPRFVAFSQFELARSILGAQVADLDEDPCWQRYVATLSDEAESSRTSLQELSRLECSDQVPNVVRVGSTRMLVKNSPGVSVMPAAPGAPGVESWQPLPGVEPLTMTAKILWDEPMLASAQKYSGVASEEIYRWRLHRARLFKQRVDASELQAGHPRTEAGFDVLRLQIGDLREIAKLSHASLSEIDRVIHDEFHAPLPETSYGVNIGTASQIVAAILVLLNAVLGAYVRAAVNVGVKSTSGTFFQVISATRWGEFVVLTLLCIPLAAVAYMDYSIGVHGSAGFYFSACAIVMLVVVLMMLWRLYPSQSRQNAHE